MDAIKNISKLSENQKILLSELYFSKDSPGAYSTVYNLFRAAKKIDSSLTQQKVKYWVDNDTKQIFTKPFAYSHYPKSVALRWSLWWCLLIVYRSSKVECNVSKN